MATRPQAGRPRLAAGSGEAAPGVVHYLDAAPPEPRPRIRPGSHMAAFEDWFKRTLVPPRIDMWRFVRKQLRRGELELRLLPLLVPRDRIALDIGANRGVYTHVLSRLTPRVEAFEPNPAVFRRLRRTLPRNARAHQVALSDRNGEAELLVPLDRGKYADQRATLSPRSADPETRPVTVPVRTLDSFDFQNVGFIKIDVEGFEQAVLRGARATLGRERPVLLIELEERHTAEPIEHSLAAVAAFGYELFFARDDAIHPIARFDPEADHRLAVATERYINNFIARPTPPAASQ